MSDYRVCNLPEGAWVVTPDGPGRIISSPSGSNAIRVAVDGREGVAEWYDWRELSVS